MSEFLSLSKIEDEVWIRINQQAFDLKESAIYDVSNYGNVRRVLLRRYKPCSFFLNRTDGRYRVKLPTNTGSKYIYVAKIVAHMFLGPRPDGLTINHKDRNRRNNHVDNLEYISQAENNRHAAATGRSKGLRSRHYTKPELTVRGVDSFTNKLSEDDVKQIRILFQENPKLNTAIKLGKKFGVSRNNIYYVLNRGWKHITS